jgi:predicted component of type VI protein secretion system
MTWLEYNDALQELRADSEVVVGTGAQASWRLRRADLMPRHFVVATTDDRATIRPFSADAVVSVNGRQLSAGSSELRDGDVISAGSGDFYFWATEPGQAPRAVKAPLMAHLIDLRRRSGLSLDRISTGIGRDDSNTLVIDNDAASSFHAEIRREAGGHALRMMDGAVVRVNGRPVSAPVLLNEGDEVEIANQVLRYSCKPLPEGITESTSPGTLTSTAETAAIALPDRPERVSAVGALGSATMARAPMRAVAFVSSVIAAVAIATLVFLHRGP